MSATETDQPAMTLFEKIEAAGHTCLTAAEHGAAWLVGMAAQAAVGLQNMETSSPFIQQAIDAGIASATRHGVPVEGIENIGAEILGLAKQFAGSLSSPPPAPEPAAVVEPPAPASATDTVGGAAAGSAT